MFHQNIRLPGVYIFNSNSTTGRGMQGAPIFSNMSNMNIIRMDETAEKVLLFPKYKVIFYPNIDYGGIGTQVDNTSGTKCLYTTGLNTASSCKIYYNETEITDVFSLTGN
jgi:hypothetical protein